MLISSTYQQHVKCMTENQKYGSKNYVEKEAKGEMKQNAWCEQVERAIKFVKEPRLKSLLENIQGYSNIPRKEAKFINFLTNSCRIRDVSLCKLAWKAIADEAEKLKKEEESKKATEEGTGADFKWKATIKRKLREAGGEMKVCYPWF
ncbi:unnamed protein product [Heligmosomoides polygyrus]|uniref:Zinc finger C2H2 LYAR-type domain-containing protein n=1 Tax=Heligmosomoides polygyrus TaxID=6339 RepID=A0A3P7XBB8_HELPZ|nr:unnamed protein product [Heligmosomoides polygyrus]